MTTEITKDAVLATGCSAVELAIKRLNDDAAIAHKRGYHAYSATLANFASDIENARSKFIDAVEAL